MLCCSIFKIRICEIYEYVKYTDTWNIRICKTFTCIGIPKHLTTLGSSGTKLLLPSWLLSFSTRVERDSISTMLTVPSDPTTRGHPVVNNWTGLAQVQKPTSFVQVQISTNSFFSKITQNPQLIASGHNVIHIPSHIFLSGVFIMTSVIVTSSPREREHLRSMCAPTRALSWTVLSLTKPKDKI